MWAFTKDKQTLGPENSLFEGREEKQKGAYCLVWMSETALNYEASWY